MEFRNYDTVSASVRAQIQSVCEIWRRHLQGDLTGVYVHGSMALNCFREGTSDVDLLVDLSGADLSGFFAIGGLYNDLEAALQKEIDLITTVALEQPCRRMSDKLFREIVNKERRKIYAVA